MSRTSCRLNRLPVAIAMITAGLLFTIHFYDHDPIPYTVHFGIYLLTMYLFSHLTKAPGKQELWCVQCYNPVPRSAPTFCNKEAPASEKVSKLLTLKPSNYEIMWNYEMSQMDCFVPLIVSAVPQAPCPHGDSM